MTEPAAGPGPASDETRAHETNARTNESIGPYRLIQPLGEGGMGTVWLAEQVRPVRRQVALKIIKAGMDTAQVVTRFEAERQALALMDHPAIARVLDAGATPEGRPYFVMECVRGESITGYCAKHRLPIRGRIDLFLQVCDGVQHAHQKGIIHRDLKPSNVLVAIQGDRPVPKIIDFGVAKATSQPLTERTLHTELGAFVGTPEYMSPEQAEMSGLDVDTRTDVYSLGAILYELLTGAMPFESKALRAQLLDELRRTIREVDPPRPSTRVTADAPAEPGKPPTQIEPSKLAGELRGDLDWITMKALEKDRTRRYGSASDLAADLRRHLEDQPVLAGPPTTTYRVGKFVRRHRGGVAAAAALVVLLAGFAVTMAVQAKRIASERDRATREQAAATALNNFLRYDVLAQASPWMQGAPDAKPDPDIKVRTALDRAAARIGGKFNGQPLVEASICETIGTTYAQLGLYREGRQQLRRSLDLRKQYAGSEAPVTLRSMDALAWIDAAEGKAAEAERQYSSLLDIYRRQLGARDPEVLRTMGNVAWNQYAQGKRDKAEGTFAELLPVEREVLGQDDERTLITMQNLGNAYLDRGDWKDAEPLLTQALSASRRTLGAEHPRTAGIMTIAAQVYGQQGRYAEAEAIRREILDIETRMLGADHLSTAAARGNLAQNLINQGVPEKRQEAERLLAEDLAISRRVRGDRGRYTDNARVNLANVYEIEGKFADAEALLRDALEGFHQLLAPDHPLRLQGLTAFARVLLAQKKYADAERTLREVVAIREKTAPNDWRRYDAMSLLGSSVAGRRAFAEAERLLVDGYQGMHERIATIPAFHRDSLADAGTRLVEFYTAWGKPAQAAEWQRKVSH